MELRFTKIKEIDGQECLIFEVVLDCNLWPYIVFDTTYDEDGDVSNVHRHSYIFPNRTVQKGDYVRLFTGKGKYNNFKNKAGTITHNYYWGFKDGVTIWNEGGDRLLLVKVQEYKRVEV